MAEFRDTEAVRDHTPHVDHDADHDHGDHDHGDHGADLAAKLGNQHVGQVLGSGVHRKGATSAQQLDEAVARTIEQRRGGGQPLDEGTRVDMEESLGHDLSDVRVHTDSTADELNEMVSARAFTTGDDVFFKQGTYDPGSASGRELLGHELTHVVQQREGTSGLSPGEVSDPSDPAEQHAESVGRELASGPTHTSEGGTGGAGGVARQSMGEEEEELQAARDPGVARQPAPEEEEELQAARDPGVARQPAPEEEEELQMAAEPGIARQAPEDEEEELQAAHEPGIARQPAPEEEEELQAAHEPGIARQAAPEEEEETVSGDPVFRRTESPTASSLPRVSRDEPRSFRRQEIHYRTHDHDTSSLPQVDTNWGTNLYGDLVEGDTGFHMGHFFPEWSSHRTGAGTPTLQVVEPTLDYRSGNFGNEEHYPETTAQVRWEHRSPDAELENITPSLQYNPDRAGGMQITVQYHYGGFVEEDGLTKGQHNILLDFTYDTNLTRSSGIEFGGEFGGDAGSISAKASSSTSMSAAARRWQREISFESFGPGGS